MESLYNEILKKWIIAMLVGVRTERGCRASIEILRKRSMQRLGARQERGKIDNFLNDEILRIIVQ